MDEGQRTSPVSAHPADDTAYADAHRRLQELHAVLGRVIVGQDALITHLITAVFSGGHVLIEGLPGLGKTHLAKALAAALGLHWARVQCTPDLMPADVTGAEIYVTAAGGASSFQFRPGPVFAQLVLVDEINRATPRTQAALLEAMQEGAVTYAGTTHALERPFFVLATQNPIEQTGTYPLPEAQLDRFLLYIRVGYPTLADERAVLARTTGAALPRPQAVAGAADILAAQALVREVTVSDALLDYATRLVRASRPADTDVAYVKEWVRWGAGPRAGQGIILAGKARALLHGRFAATLDDLRAVAAPVLRHRVLVNFRAEGEGVTPDDVTGALLTQVPAPKSPLG